MLHPAAAGARTLPGAGAAGSRGAARDGQKPRVFNGNGTGKPERSLPECPDRPGFTMLLQHSSHPRCALLRGLLIAWVIQGEMESAAGYGCGSGGCTGGVGASPLG